MLTKDKESGQLAVTEHEPSNIGELLQTFLKSPEGLKNVEVAERMFALLERSEARNAEKDFNRDFSALQQKLIGFKATQPIPDREGNTKYYFLPYDELMERLSPLLGEYGFSLSFDTDNDGTKVTQKCTLIHKGGHSRTNQFTARTSPPPKSSNAQADGATSTFAKRYAVCNMFNIVAEQKDTDASLASDARLEGAFIGPDKIQFLKEQVKEVNYNEPLLFKLAGCLAYEEVTEGKYQVLLNAIDIKRSRI